MPGRIGVARSTAWNIAGQLLPGVVALATIPPLISRLGSDRFGLLTIAWVVMGYFGLFDLGMGRATTSFIASAIGGGRHVEVGELVTNSLAAHALLGLAGGGILFAISGWLTGVLTIPPALVHEAELVFRLLALSVPLVVLTSAARGVLEAMHRFDLVNMVKLPASALNYVAPLVVLIFTKDLAFIVAVVVVARAVVLFTYLLMCRNVLGVGLLSGAVTPHRVRPLFSFGTWVTISSMLGMAIAAVDRFVIGSRINVAAVTLYATPFEVLTRIYVIAASLLAVMFPIFSAVGTRNPDELRILSSRSTRFLYLLIAPVVFLLLAFVGDLLALWLGREFANATVVLSRILLIGIMVNSLAQSPFTLLQGVGRANAAAVSQVLTFVLYLPAIWFLASGWGIAGVAFGWTARGVLETIVLFWMEKKLVFPTRPLSEFTLDAAMIPLLAVTAIAGWYIPVVFPHLAPRFLASVVFLAILLSVSWRVVIDSSERVKARSILREWFGRAGSVA